MIDCKTCNHGTILIKQDKENKHKSAYGPIGWVMCCKPKYNGREYPVKDTRRKCDAYERKVRRDKSEQ